jgi:hypothetical protein
MKDNPMKTLLSALFLAFMAVSNIAYAETYAVPDKNPAFAITVPDTWEDEESEYGYTFQSPDEDVLFSIEYSSGRSVNKMIDANFAWMKENNIVPQEKPVEEDFELGGNKGKIYIFKAKDDDGDTLIDLVLIDAGDNRAVMLTLWASEKARETNKADIDAIKASLKAIK